MFKEHIEERNNHMQELKQVYADKVNEAREANLLQRKDMQQRINLYRNPNSQSQQLERNQIYGSTPEVNPY